MIQATGGCSSGRRERRYDVVIADVPDPSTSQLNRFYTREFFAEVRRILTPGGVLSFSLGTYENYLGKELGRMIGVAYQTLAGRLRQRADASRRAGFLPGLRRATYGRRGAADGSGRREGPAGGSRLSRRECSRPTGWPTCAGPSRPTPR